MTESIFDKSIAELRMLQRGDILSADTLNDPRRAINKWAQGVAPVRQIARTRSLGGGGGLLGPYLLIDIMDGYFVCKEYIDGAATGEDVLIAMSWDLRKKEWDGKTVDGVTYTYDPAKPDQVLGLQRTATDATPPPPQGQQPYSEDQAITPPFIRQHSKLFAHSPGVKKVGITVSGVELALLDANTAGRAFAVKE